MRKVIGCTHFEDENMASLRGFSSVEEMNSFMETIWNENVSEDDLVYVLGDFAVKRPSYWQERLRGKKILILGNHDGFMAKEAGFVSVQESLTVRLRGTRETMTCFLSHYPHLSWPERGSGSVHLHAHCHGRQPASLKGFSGPARLDMSAELWNYTPVPLFKAITISKEKESDYYG